MIYNNYHIFKKNNKYFLYDISTLITFEISKVCFKILQNNSIKNPKLIFKRLNKTFNLKILKNAYSKLKKWEILTNSKKVNYYIFENPFKNVKVSKNFFLNGIYLIVSQDCNLRCRYCSAGFGNFGNINNSGLMTEETAKKSIDFLLSHLDKENKKPHIIFVGGEPLLNFKIMKFVIEYIKNETNIKPIYMLNTNGTLMNEKIAKWLVNNNIPLRFSIDGTREIHNSNRVYRNGKGSYDKTIKGLKNYQKYNKNGLSIQTSINKGADIVNAVHNLWKIGANHVLANLTAESPFIKFKKLDNSKKNWNDYIKGLEKLNFEITNNLINNNYSPIIHNAIKYLELLFKKERKFRGCGICKVITIDKNGNIYPCQGLVGKYNYMIGNIYNSLDFEKIELLGETFANFLNKCNKCWAVNICGGSCVALSIQYDEMNDDYEPSRWCNVYKKQIEFSIYLYNLILEKKPELFKTLFIKE